MLPFHLDLAASVDASLADPYLGRYALLQDLHVRDDADLLINKFFTKNYIIYVEIIYIFVLNYVLHGSKGEFTYDSR